MSDHTENGHGDDPLPPNPSHFDTNFIEGQIVEITSEEQGFEGSWFAAKILQPPSKENPQQYLVEYQTLMDNTGKNPLREYVHFCLITPPYPDRPTRLFQVNDVVDAFYEDSWWTGVVTQVLENSMYSVYFQPSNVKMEFKQLDIRAHMEWIGGKWVDTPQNQASGKEFSDDQTKSLRKPSRRAKGLGKRARPGVDCARKPAKSSIENLHGRFSIQGDEPTLGELLKRTIESNKGKRHKVTHSRSCDSGITGHLKGNESESTTRTMINVLVEGTEKSDTDIEDNLQTPSLFLEKTDNPKVKEKTDSSKVKDSGGPKYRVGNDELANVQIETLLNPTTMNDLDRGPYPINEGTHSGITTSNTDLSIVEYDHTLKFPKKTNSFGNRDSYVMSDEIPAFSKNICWPFIKKSPMWETIESMDAFKLFNQRPHFRPLEKEIEGLREGNAMGHMLSFASLVESTCNARLDDPRSMFESNLKALNELEKFGFTVKPICSQLEEMLKKKDGITQLIIEKERLAKEMDEKIEEATFDFDRLVAACRDGSVME